MIELSTAQEEKAYAIYNGLVEHHQGDHQAALVHLCSAFALITSTQKDDREQGKQIVREMGRIGRGAD